VENIPSFRNCRFVSDCRVRIRARVGSNAAQTDEKMKRNAWQVYRWAGLFLAFQVAGCKTLPDYAVFLLVFVVLGATPFLLYWVETAVKVRYFAAGKTKRV
jgi:hypothetical protein